MAVKAKSKKRKLSPETMEVVRQARQMFPKATKGRSDWSIYLDAIKASKKKYSSASKNKAKYAKKDSPVSKQMKGSKRKLNV